MADIKTDVEDEASGIAARAREVATNAEDVAENFQTALDRSVRDQPLTTLAAAAAVGFVLGAIWKA